MSKGDLVAMQGAKPDYGLQFMVLSTGNSSNSHIFHSKSSLIRLCPALYYA